MTTWSLKGAKPSSEDLSNQYFIECEFEMENGKIVVMVYNSSGMSRFRSDDKPSIIRMDEINYMCKITRAIWLLTSTNEDIRKSKVYKENV